MVLLFQMGMKLVVPVPLIEAPIGALAPKVEFAASIPGAAPAIIGAKAVPGAAALLVLEVVACDSLSTNAEAGLTAQRVGVDCL